MTELVVGDLSQWLQDKDRDEEKLRVCWWKSVSKQRTAHPQISLMQHALNRLGSEELAQVIQLLGLDGGQVIPVTTGA